MSPCLAGDHGGPSRWLVPLAPSLALLRSKLQGRGLACSRLVLCRHALATVQGQRVSAPCALPPNRSRPPASEGC